MKAAKKSPRMEDDGTLRWYEGDTFSITFEFDLRDADGSAISPKPSDRIGIQFTDGKSIIHELEAVGTFSPTVVFTDEVSAKFKEGTYSILARLRSDNVTTLLKENKVVVE